MSFKVICDVHISYKIVKYFASKDYEAIHVNDILDGSSTKDSDIANYADRHGFVVLTKDADFKTSHLLRAKPKRVLRVSLGNISNNQLISILDSNLQELTLLFQAEKCFVEIGSDYMEVIT